MTIDALVMAYLRGLAANATAAAPFTVANYRPTATKPVLSTSRLAIDFGSQGRKERNTLLVFPFGGNDNNDLIDVKVSGWNRVGPKSQSLADEWISALVCTVQGTLSNALPGLAGQPVVATDLFCDTLTLTNGVAVLRQGVADVDIASFLCDVSGFELVTVDPVTDTNGDGANFLYGFQ